MKTEKQKLFIISHSQSPISQSKNKYYLGYFVLRIIAKKHWIISETGKLNLLSHLLLMTVFLFFSRYFLFATY